MSNQRGAGQSLIGCHVDDSFAEEIDSARGRDSRSDFLRKAIWWYLTERLGLTVPSHYMYAPDRAGKGGRPRKITAAASVMNEDTTPSPMPEQKAVNYSVKKTTKGKKR